MLAMAASFTPALGQEIVRIPTAEEQVAQCAVFAGSSRDECVVNLVFTHEDPALCGLAPDSRCAAIVGELMMERCNTRYAGDELLFCEIAVAQETGVVEACTHATEVAGCFAAVAAKRGDPRLIVEHLGDPLARDMALATYAMSEADPSVLELIEDNRRHDLGMAAVVPSIAIGRGERVDPAYCNRLRGGYESSDEGLGAEGTRELCEATVAFSNRAAAMREVAETEAEREAVGEMIAELSAAVERGEIELGDIIALGGDQPPTGCASIPGVWSWFVNGDVTFHADGTQEQGRYFGTWSCSGSSVTMSWSHGFDDDLTLSDDGTSLTGTGASRDPNGPRGYRVTGSKQ